LRNSEHHKTFGEKLTQTKIEKAFESLKSLLLKSVIDILIDISDLFFIEKYTNTNGYLSNPKIFRKLYENLWRQIHTKMQFTIVERVNLYLQLIFLLSAL